MKQIIRLAESDLHSIVRQVVKEAVDELTGKQRMVVTQHGKDSVDASIVGSPNLPSGRPTIQTVKQVADMDEQSLYMMLTPFKSKPFSFAINYQGVDVIVEFWVERMTQAGTQFTIEGTMFMKNGAKLLGRMFINVDTDINYIKIRSDRNKYFFTPIQKSSDYWETFITELKDSIL